MPGSNKPNHILKKNNKKILIIILTTNKRFKINVSFVSIKVIELHYYKVNNEFTKY